MELKLSRAGPEQLLIERKIKSLLPNGCQRILLIEPPNVPEEDFDPEVAANNRYPVYEAYVLGVISSCIELRGYTTDIIDLNFMLQDRFKNDPENFKYRIWEEMLKQNFIDTDVKMDGPIQDHSIDPNSKILLLSSNVQKGHVYNSLIALKPDDVVTTKIRLQNIEVKNKPLTMYYRFELVDLEICK